jgi:alpha-amylase
MRSSGHTRLAASRAFVLAFLVCVGGCSNDPAGPGASPVEDIVVSPPTASVIVGGTLTLSAEVRNADGEVLQEPRVSWASEDTTIATVSTDGVVTARNIGTVLIAASARGKDAFATVIVNAPAVGHIVISPQNPRIEEGETVQLTATVYDANNQVLGAGIQVAWTSANTNRATVSSNGLVLGIRQGNVVVSATAGGKTGSTTIRVEDD